MVTQPGLRHVVYSIAKNKGTSESGKPMRCFGFFDSEINHSLERYSLAHHHRFFLKKSVKRVAKDLGINSWTLNGWLDNEERFPSIVTNELKKIPLRYSSELAYVLGAYVGGGYYRFKESRQIIEIALGSKSKEYRKKIERVFEKVAPGHIKRKKDLIQITGSNFRFDLTEIVHERLFGYVYSRKEQREFISGFVDSKGHFPPKIENQKYYLSYKNYIFPDEISNNLVRIFFSNGFLPKVCDTKGLHYLSFSFLSDLRRLAEFSIDPSKREDLMNAARIHPKQKEVDLQTYFYIMSETKNGQEKGLRQKLAKETGISQCTLKSWTRGKNPHMPRKVNNYNELKELEIPNMKEIGFAMRYLELTFEEAKNYMSSKSIEDIFLNIPKRPSYLSRTVPNEMEEEALNLIDDSSKNKNFLFYDFMEYRLEEQKSL